MNMLFQVGLNGLTHLTQTHGIQLLALLLILQQLSKIIIKLVIEHLLSGRVLVIIISQLIRHQELRMKLTSTLLRTSIMEIISYIGHTSILDIADHYKQHLLMLNSKLEREVIITMAPDTQFQLLSHSSFRRTHGIQDLTVSLDHSELTSVKELSPNQTLINLRKDLISLTILNLIKQYHLGAVSLIILFHRIKIKVLLMLNLQIQMMLRLQVSLNMVIHFGSNGIEQDQCSLEVKTIGIQFQD